MTRVLFVCPTHRDYREIERLHRGDAFLFHDYATAVLGELISEERPTETSIADPINEVEHIVRKCREMAIDCVVSTDDYPGSAMASIVARRLNLPGIDPAVNLLCQHKYHARRAQLAHVPEATPDFVLLDGKGRADSAGALGFPLFVKPVKSMFSVGAERVNSARELPDALRRATLPPLFFEPFAALLEHYSNLEMGGHVLAETLLEGRQQCTLEGYARGGRVHVFGIVDSITFPGTLCFERFE